MSFGNTFTIPEHTKRQLQDSFTAAVQQRESKFKPVMNVDPEWTAKQYVKRMRDTIAWRVNNTRFGTTNAEEFEAGFRSGFWQNLEATPKKFDRADQRLLDSIPLPTGPVIEDMMMGLARIQDDLFIAASTADALGGAEPYITPQAFPSEQAIDVGYIKPLVAIGANQGLTPWKVMEARRRFKAAFIDFDMEEMVLAISSEEENQLVLSAEAAPNEAWAKVTLDWFQQRLSGKMDAKLMGYMSIDGWYITLLPGVPGGGGPYRGGSQDGIVGGSAGAQVDPAVTPQTAAIIDSNVLFLTTSASPYTMPGYSDVSLIRCLGGMTANADCVIVARSLVARWCVFHPGMGMSISGDSDTEGSWSTYLDIGA